MKNNKLAAVAIAAAALIGLAGCASQGAAAPKAEKIVHLDASWALSATSVSELTKSADAVVEGTVDAVAGTSVKKGIPYTDFTFDVDQWLKGTPGADSILIHQTGGKVDDTTSTVDGDPLLQVGTHYILYLKQYQTGKYFIVGGPTGRFNVDAEGTVSAMPEGTARDGLPASVSQLTQRTHAISSGTSK